MNIIHVPSPPKTAFNKNRRVSDLIRAQVNHLKHVENKLSTEQRATIPQHEISTEDDAARYIAAMTRLLRIQPAAVTMPAPVPIAKTRRAPSARPLEGLALAAGASESAAASSAKSKRASSKKSAAGPSTGKTK